MNTAGRAAGSSDGGAHGPRVALVTGGGSGIGRAIALRLAGEGASVAVFDRDADAARAVTAAIQATGGTARPFVADTASPAEVDQALAAIAASLGPMDTCVIAAGVASDYGPVDALSIEEFDRVLGVNLRGAFLVMRRAIPQIRAAGGGSITAVASVDGLQAEMGLAAYCASKGGLVNLCRTIALDTAREGIRVNVVCPTATDTPMIRARMATLPDGDARMRAIGARHPVGRLLQPDEVAACVAFLASPEASGITGATMLVDLGLTAGWEAYQPPSWRATGPDLTGS